MLSELLHRTWLLSSKIVLLRRHERQHSLKTRVILVHLIKTVVVTLMRSPASLPRKAVSPTDQYGRALAMDTARKVRASLPSTLLDRPRASRLINDQLLCSYSACDTTAWQQRDFRAMSDFKYKLTCFRSSPFCCQASTKERFKSCYCKTSNVIKVCETCFLCRSVEFCPECHKCPSCCSRSTCWGQIAPIFGNMGSPKDQSQGIKNSENSTLSPSRSDQY